MAKRVQITNQGMALLASSSQATGQYYWLGYYAPAYVPNIWKASNTIVFPPSDCGNVNGGTPILPIDTDNVTPNMSMLTKYGDIVYNVWQGDLTGTGYANGVSDGSAGGDQFGMTMYDKNIKKHYRYVLDSNGNNTLVVWTIKNPNTADGSMLGYHVYKGTDGFNQSTMPIPAPLYYLGDTLGRSTTENYFIHSPYFDDEYYNGATQYPSIEVTLADSTVFHVPKISIDARYYKDSNGLTSATLTLGDYFDTNPIPPAPAYDDTGWYQSDLGKQITESDVWYCTEFWKLHTISNYNRFHASVDSIGHVLNTDLSNRNMAKSTKLFPISNYKVINTETGYTANNDRVEIATAIKLSIDIDLSPNSLHQGLTGTALNQNSEQGFFDIYEYADTVNHTHDDTNSSGSLDQLGNDLYVTVHNSFKFNRIGIYAVPMRSSPIMSDNGFGYETQNDVARLQFQINPDEEPVLFAVVDWDNTVILSDTGDGIHQFKADFDIDRQRYR